MKRIQTKLAAILVLCACLSVPSWASATIYWVQGTVGLLMAQDSGFGANGDWFTLSGVAPQGTCPKAGVGTDMGIWLKDDQNGSRQYAFVLAAWMAGMTFTVRVDDTIKNAAGGCYAEFIY